MIVLSLLAHPDDAEMLCAGTLIRLTREHAARIHVATVTPGDCGSATLPPEEIARIRRAEAAAAAAVIGATYHCLEERDLRVAYTPTALEKVVRLLRSVRPDVVLTHSPSDYHLDHEMTSVLTRAAAFAAPVPNFQRGDGAALEHVPHLYYCDPVEGKDPLGQEVPPGLVIDISSVIDVKADMLARHASQREWLLKHHGMDEYIHAMREWGAQRGRSRGLAFAEGFRQHRGHGYPQDDRLGQLLGTV